MKLNKDPIEIGEDLGYWLEECPWCYGTISSEGPDRSGDVEYFCQKCEAEINVSMEQVFRVTSYNPPVTPEEEQERHGIE